MIVELFFVRGGSVYRNYQQLSNAGQYGNYWSSRAHSSYTGYAYYLSFYTSVDPSYYNNRYRGYSLRCLIPTT